MTASERDIVVVGGGHAGLAAGWHLLRAARDFVILDNGAGPGGAWRHGRDSRRLFSPAGYSSLPGLADAAADARRLSDPRRRHRLSGRL